MREFGVDHTTIYHLAKSSKKTYPLSKVPAQTEVYIEWTNQQKISPNLIELKLSALKSVVYKKVADSKSWKPSILMHPTNIKIETFNGVVSDSLWSSAQSAKMDSNLIIRLAEIMAWQVDFNREVRKKDKWRLVVESVRVGEKHIGWGNILAAEYINKSDSYKAIFFDRKNSNNKYYFTDGRSLKRMFLKSPIKFGRISSRFKRKRFHPILKINRPHNGVDYAAKRGTPIRSVGKGTVRYIGRKGGAGKMVKIRHNSTYQTAYLHMSRFKKGIRKGSKVKQGDVIGYVGSTGYATGPHLHFSFYERGRYVDPLGKKFPSADPIAKKDKTSFSKNVEKFEPLLPSWEDDIDIIAARKKESNKAH
jgi:murein DD-endopeptidase MepM/ murein hydrolase activator NlpD